MLDLRQNTPWWFAFIAGFVFVLQTFTVAWAAGAMAVGPQLDAFGNALCITSTDHDRSIPADEHSNLSDCCTFGCGTTWTTVAGPAGDVVVFRRPLLGSDVFFRVHLVARPKAPDHEPRNPRAPPLTV